MNLKLQIAIFFAIVIARTTIEAITIFNDNNNNNQQQQQQQYFGNVAKKNPVPYGFQRKWTQYQPQPQPQLYHHTLNPTKILKEKPIVKNTLSPIKNFNGHFHHQFPVSQQQLQQQHHQQQQQQPVLVKTKKIKNTAKPILRKPINGPWPHPIKLNTNFVGQMYPQFIQQQQHYQSVPVAASSSLPQSLFPLKNKDFLDKSIDSPAQLNHLVQVPSINIKIIKQIGEKGPIRTIPAPNLSVKDKPNFSKSSSLFANQFLNDAATVSDTPAQDPKYSLRNRTLSHHHHQQQQHQYQVNEDDSISNGNSGTIYSASGSQSALPVRNSILILPSSKRQRMPLIKYPVQQHHVPINLKVYNDHQSSLSSSESLFNKQLPLSLSNYQAISFVQPANLEQSSDNSRDQSQQNESHQSSFPAQSFYQLETAGSEHKPIVIKYNNYSSVIKTTSNTGDNHKSDSDDKDNDNDNVKHENNLKNNSDFILDEAADNDDTINDFVHNKSNNVNDDDADDAYVESNPNVEDYYYISEEPSSSSSSSSSTSKPSKNLVKFGSKIQ